MASFELVAHRGYPLRFPDNSMSGVRAALEHEARFLEIDVQMSRSGTIWLFHDEHLQRVSGRQGRLVEQSDEQIESLRASETARLGLEFADERLTRLVEVARELEVRPDVFTFVEIKPVAVKEFGADVVVDAVAECLERLVGQVAIISFSIECLRAVKQRTPHSYGLILTDWEQVNTDLPEIGGEFVFCNYEKLPPGPLPDLDARLAVYEVVDPELARELGERGAEFVETFAIAEMREALGQ